MDADQFREAAHAAIEEIIQYNQSLEKYPVLAQIKPGYLAPQLPTSIPEHGEPWSKIQPDIASKIVPGLTHWQSPNFMAFFPACATYPGILGEMYSSAFTAPAFNWLCSPACTELETVVLDWLAKAFDLPPAFLSTSESAGGGVIQGSASEAIVTVMVAARERYLHAKCDAEGLAPESEERDERIAELRGKLVALATDQTHSSTQKGARIAGTRFRAIPTKLNNGNFAMTGNDLKQSLDKCKAESLEPYYLTLTLGTTSTCAVDDFASLEPILKDYPNMWVHVDAAYAGAALICSEYSSKLSPLMRVADSFNMNMHKWLLTNFDASCLWLQNRNDVTRAMSISAAYYTNKHSDSGLVTDYRDWQIPLGRRFRALKIWFVARTYGIEGMREHIRKTVKLGDLFADLVRSRADDLFELVTEPAFALTCFRVKPSVLSSSGGSNDERRQNVTDAAFEPTAAVDQELEQQANEVTQRVTDLINERGELFITGSHVAGKTFIRVVSANANAAEKNILNAFDVIVKTTREVLSNRGVYVKERLTNGVNGTPQ